jgi:hypothetical protein
LLQGFRGRPAADLEALEDTLVRVSYLAMHLEGRLAELERVAHGPQLKSTTRMFSRARGRDMTSFSLLGQARKGEPSSDSWFFDVRSRAPMPLGPKHNKLSNLATLIARSVHSRSVDHPPA